jgi:hypothetical protein
MKKEYRRHCYGNKKISIEKRCSNDKDNCKWLIPCKILCNYKIDMFEYSLVNLLIKILPRTEIVQILMKNYSISHHAAKMSTKRWRYIIENRKSFAGA